MFYNYFKQVPPTALLLHFVLRGGRGVSPSLDQSFRERQSGQEKEEEWKGLHAAMSARCAMETSTFLAKQIALTGFAVLFFFYQLFFLTTKNKKRNLIIVDKLIDLSVCVCVCFFFFVVL